MRSSFPSNLSAYFLFDLKAELRIGTKYFDQNWIKFLKKKNRFLYGLNCVVVHSEMFFVMDEMVLSYMDEMVLS